jgi:hypothetical protein
MDSATVLMRELQVTTRGVVEACLRRVQAYNSTCVNEPQGILGPITPIRLDEIDFSSAISNGPAANGR